MNSLIIIRGCPAVGKSTLAKNLASHYSKSGKVALLIPDQFKWVMTAHDNRTLLDQKLAFNNFLHILKSYLKTRYQTVIIEDTWDTDGWDYEKVLKIGKKYNYQIQKILLTADWKIITKRNKFRPMVVNQKQLKAQFENIYKKTHLEEKEINTNYASEDEIVKKAISFLAEFSLQK